MSGVIGISTAESGRYSIFYASLEGMQLPSEPIQKVFARSAVISENRNAITKHALDSGADWVLYLDDDHILTRDVLTHLLAADKDVVSAHYVQRQAPFAPVAMSAELPNGRFMKLALEPTQTGLLSVAAVGAGCMLVKRRVLEALEAPYWTLGQIHPSSWGDDLHFCSRVRKAGFEIFIDLDNPVGHLMTGTVWPSHSVSQGWVTNYAADPTKPVLAKWPMPLPGDI